MTKTPFKAPEPHPYEIGSCYLTRIPRAFEDWANQTETPTAPEVDPDLIEARAICAARAKTDNFRSACLRGAWDHTKPVATALAGIKRGRELAKPKPLTNKRLNDLVNDTVGIRALTDAINKELGL